jgi:hypothetical protein
VKQLRATLLGGIVFLVAQLAWAAEVTGLYQVREPLAGSTEEAREQAFGQAFTTLLQRLTGSAGSAQNPALAAARSRPQDLALGFTYLDNELRVSFDPGSVMQVLRDAQVPLWGQERPVLLLWWAEDGLHGRQLLGDGHPHTLELRQAAQHRGLPVRFPLGDLNEQVQADSGWSGTGQSGLEELLQRYGADALLAVEARNDAGMISGSWQLLGTSLNQEGRLQGQEVPVVADSMFQSLAQAMAREYAIVPGQGDLLQVRLQNLELDSMVAAEKALQVFDGRLVKLQDDQAVWQVTALPDQLRSQLALYKFREVPASWQAEPADAGNRPQELIFVR